MSNDQKIIDQVEFYFGDANLSRDKFLQERVKEDEGWVSLETIASFSRMKSLGAESTSMAGLLKDSSVLEVSEDGKKVRRQHPLPDAVGMSSLYVKGFPQDATLEQLQEYFRAQCPEGSILAVWMRRVPNTKIFKGSVFLDLKDEESAQQVLSKSLTYGDKPLLVLTKTAYLAGKQAEKEAKAKKSVKNTIAQDYVRGCLLKLEHPGELSHQAIRTALGSDHPVAFVDRFENAHWIRFKAPIADKALEAHPQLTIGDLNLTLVAVSEAEEAAFFARFAEKFEETRSHGKSFKRPHHRDSRPDAKKAKTEEQVGEVQAQEQILEVQEQVHDHGQVAQDAAEAEN